MVKLYFQNFRSFSTLNYFIIIFYFLLSLFISNMWDAYNFDYAFSIGKLEGLKLWANENSHKCFLVIINSLYFLKNKLQLSNEILFDVFNFASLFLYVSQIAILGKILFKLETQWEKILLTIVLIFPLWEGFTSLPLGFYLFYYGICLLGFRLFFYSDNWMRISTYIQ